MDIDNYLKLLHEIDDHSAQFRLLVTDCTLQEFRILDLVAKQPGYRLNDLGHERQVYQQGIGRMAARLETKGLAVVVQDERDGRAKNLVLTDLGCQVRAKCRRVLQEVVG